MPAVTIRFAAVVAAWFLLAAPAVWAQEAAPQDDTAGASVDYLIEPGPDADVSPGGWFLLELEPGTEVRQELLVHNRGDEPIVLELAAVDADTGPIGGASYRRLDEPVEATGAWITLDRDRAELGPDETDTVGFTVAAPADANSGEHLAGIAAWVPEDVEEVEESSGASIAIEQRRVVAVQVALPGPAEPILTVSGVEAEAGPAGVRLMVHIANEGRGLTSGEGVLEIIDTEFEETFEFGTFIPGTAIAYPVLWTDERPPEGEYQARVRLEHGMWTETWEGTFTVGEALAEDLDLYLEESGIPWVWVAGAAAAVLALAAFGWSVYRLGRRAAKPPRQPPSEGAPPPRAKGQPSSWSSPAPRDSPRR